MMPPAPDSPTQCTHCDVVVIGGGPAGASAATLLAARGLAVVVLERERFPRFHIGESLLPFSNPLLDRLGVRERIASAGFVVKCGATFLFENGATSAAIRFAEGLDADHGSTFQVPRDRFDAILLENAATQGATVLQQTRADDVELAAERVCVTVRPADAPRTAEPRLLSARYLIDASGQSGFLAKRLRLRETDPQLVNVAVFAHYRGVTLPPELPAGDIQVVSLSDLGWLWIIPLGEGHFSVGAVVPKSAFKRREGGDRNLVLADLIASSSAASAQLRSAHRITETRYEANFSYGCTRYVGDRWLLAGDAGSFLDPVFSTGVLLALEAGAAAADTVIEALSANTSRARRALQRYQRQQRLRYRHFRRYVRRFYDPAFRDLLCRPGGPFSIPEAMTTILAGARRPSFGVRWRIALFETITRLHRVRPVTERLHLRGKQDRATPTTP